ncbi:uncharacterized protein LOC122363612 [Amphibalanus amphitrite]|uniref:uncharacterized protein LOC122363612 n=1 Tax=Amphibalanus amphitrite TaxID=1232801 RepID=UPI001C90F6CF|nr:uncharacterized protein LOC122363612 [Amphibalanus amphitrite]
MPPRRQPPALYRLCLSEAVLWLWSAADAVWQAALLPSAGAAAAADDELQLVLRSAALRRLRAALLARLPGPGLQALLDETLRDGLLPARVRATALAALLAPGVSRLVTGSLPERQHAALMAALADGGGSLALLDLRGAWLAQPELERLGELLPQLPALEQLVVPHVASDRLLQQLAGSCPRLQLLDVSMSREVTGAGAAALVAGGAHRRLTVVRLGCPGRRGDDPSAGVALLSALPRLVCLGENEHGAECVLAARRRGAIATCRLTYLHACVTDRAQMAELTAACPHLRGLYLDSPHEDAVPLLRRLAALQKLKLRRAPAAAVTAQLGGRLVWLELLQPRGPLDLTELAQLTPRLQKLELVQAELAAPEEPPLPPGPAAGLSAGPAAWPHLLEARLLMTAAPAAAWELLLAAERLQRLTVDGAEQLTDAQLVRQLAAGRCRQLQQLWLGWAPQLHVRGVRALLDSCPQLSSLGNVEGIAVEPEVWEQLQIEALMENLDVTFTTG